MTLGSPWWLLALVALPLAAYGQFLARRRRRARAGALAAQGLVSADPSSSGGWRGNLPFVFVLVALGLLVTAAARPMATVETVHRQATVILAIDVSNSMAAKDAKPSRLGLAEQAARSFVEDQPSGVRIGVVAFGQGSAVVQQPTSDHEADIRAIDHLSIGGGTSLSTGILSALDALAGKNLKINATALNEDNSGNIDIGYFGGATVVLISDGENTNQANPVTMAKVASTAGVRIQTLGVGSTAGTTVKIGGFTVATAADPTTLQDVASVANGSFHQVSGSAVASVAKSINLHFAVVSEHTEAISALFVLGAALLLAVGALLSLAWFGRVV